MSIAEQGADEPTLKPDAIGILSSIGVGVAATTPGVSVAIVFGLLAAGVGTHIPAVVLLGFIPILLISGAYFHLNKEDPDCGTVFSWATRAFGPWVGWFGGWIVVAALAVIVTNFAQLLGYYSFILVDWDSAAASTFWVTVLGTAWFLVLTAVAYRGIELSKKVQLPFLAFELIIFIVFATVAIVKSSINNPKGSLTPSIEWFNPAGVSSNAIAGGFVLAALLYWGWDTSVMVNEESEERRRNPGRAAVISTILLLGFYVFCAVGVLAWSGVDPLANADGDIISALAPQVFGTPWDKTLEFAVLTSSIAGCLFLPIGGARTLLSMSRQGALPKEFSEIHPRYQTPGFATLAFAAVSLVYYIGMTMVSQTILLDSLSALGLLVAFYYALTGLACVVFFRSRWKNGSRDFLLLGLAPLVGSLALLYVLAKTVKDYTDPVNSATSWLGVGAPLLIAVVIVLLGLVGAGVARLWSPEFFDRRPEVAPATGAV